jgi:hypothetical protein
MIMDPEKIELIPDQETKPEPVFTKPEEYDEFCRKFVEDVKPELEKQREARQQSEIEAKQRWMR